MTPKRKKLIFRLLVTAACITALVLRILSAPTGGELRRADFRKGYDLYVRDGYSVSWEAEYHSGAKTITPHSLWSVSDEQLKDDILLLCREIESFRQYIPWEDLLTTGQTTEEVYLPCIYFDTGDYFYRILIYNWDNYASDLWNSTQIWQERFGEPTLRVWRVDMSLIPEGEDRLTYGMGYVGRDSVNSPVGQGWFSTLPQEEWDALLALANSVSAENAEVVASFGG